MAEVELRESRVHSERSLKFLTHTVVQTVERQVQRLEFARRVSCTTGFSVQVGSAGARAGART